MHEPFVRGILQQPRDPTRVDDTVHASTKGSCGECTLKSFQGRPRGTPGGFEYLPGHLLERGRGLYGRGSDKFVSQLWALECFYRSAIAANYGWLLWEPPAVAAAALLPAGLPPSASTGKSDPRARLCYFLNFGYNHGHDCHRLQDAEMGKVVFSRDVAWYHPEAPLIPPATAVGNPPTAPPEDIYVPITTPVPSVAAPAPVPPAPAPALSPTPIPAPAPKPAPPTSPPPIPMSNSPAPIPPRVSRELAHEGYLEMPGRTRGETRAMRDASRKYAHRHGLPLDHAALV